MPKTIGRFFLRVLCWVPPIFLAWYVLVPVLHWPIRWFLAGMALLGIPSFITDVEQTVHGFDFVTSLTPALQPGEAFRPDAIITTEVDARLYSYGTALLATLTFAAWHPERWKNLWYGWLLLLPFQMAAVYAVAMKQILINGGASVIAQTDWAQWQIEVIAYLYQFSTLIMPPVTALVIWLLLHRKFIEKFVGADVIALIRADEKRRAQNKKKKAAAAAS